MAREAARPEAWRWGSALAIAALALGAIAPVASWVPVSPRLAYLFAFACVSAEVLVASALAPRVGRRGLAWAIVPALALAGVAASPLAEVPAAMIVTVALLAAGTLVGGVVGGAIERAGHLLVVAILSAIVDAFSVLSTSGPTAQILEVDAAVNVLLLPWPMLGAGSVEPILGVGDITFAAIYLGAARRHGLSIRRTVLALACGLAATAMAVLVTERGLPALPFLGAAVVIAHPEARRVPREDRAKAAIGVGAIAAVLGALLALR